VMCAYLVGERRILAPGGRIKDISRQALLLQVGLGDIAFEDVIAEPLQRDLGGHRGLGIGETRSSSSAQPRHSSTSSAQH
jgi:hypothetical protein